MEETETQIVNGPCNNVAQRWAIMGKIKDTIFKVNWPTWCITTKALFINNIVNTQISAVVHSKNSLFECMIIICLCIAMKKNTEYSF